MSHYFKYEPLERPLRKEKTRLSHNTRKLASSASYTNVSLNVRLSSYKRLCFTLISIHSTSEYQTINNNNEGNISFIKMKPQNHHQKNSEENIRSAARNVRIKYSCLEFLDTLGLFINYVTQF